MLGHHPALASLDGFISAVDMRKLLPREKLFREDFRLQGVKALVHPAMWSSATWVSD
jgi:hypothetical protein